MNTSDTYFSRSAAVITQFVGGARRLSTLTARTPALALAVAAGVVASLGAASVVAAPAVTPQATKPAPVLPQGPVAKVGAPIDVQLRLSQMQCIGLSREEGLNNDRDEV